MAASLKSRRRTGGLHSSFAGSDSPISPSPLWRIGGLAPDRSNSAVTPGRHTSCCANRFSRKRRVWREEAVGPDKVPQRLAACVAARHRRLGLALAHGRERGRAGLRSEQPGGAGGVFGAFDL